MTTSPPGRWKRTDESDAGAPQTPQTPKTPKTVKPEAPSSSGEQPMSQKWVSRPDDAHGIGQFPDPLPPRRAAQPKQAPSTDDTRAVPVHAGDGASFRQGVRTSWPEQVAAGTSSTAPGHSWGTVDASVTRTGNQGVQDVPGIEVLGRRVTPPMLSGAIGALVIVSLLVFFSSWLTVETGAAVQFFGGGAGFSVNGFGVASGPGGRAGFAVVLAPVALLLLAAAAVQAYRRPRTRFVPWAVVASGAVHLLAAAVFVAVAYAGNEEFTHEEYGRMASVTVAGGWFMGVLVGILLVILGIAYVVLHKKSIGTAGASDHDVRSARKGR
jgi:hypothetical protein